MFPIDQIKSLFANITIQKGIKSLVKLVVSFLTAGVAAQLLKDYGVTINPEELTLALTALINTALEMLRNYLKVKYGWKIL